MGMGRKHTPHQVGLREKNGDGEIKFDVTKFSDAKKGVKHDKIRERSDHNKWEGPKKNSKKMVKGF